MDYVKIVKNNNKNTVLKYLFNERQFPGAAWVTVTKTDFIKTQKIYFTEGIKAEDVDWLLNVFLNAKSFEKQGFCEVIDEDTMTTDVLLDTIKKVYDNRADYIESMRVSGLSNGVDTIISLIKDVTL